VKDMVKQASEFETGQRNKCLGYVATFVQALARA
jgi:hypothetical protein